MKHSWNISNTHTYHIYIYTIYMYISYWNAYECICGNKARPRAPHAGETRWLVWSIGMAPPLSGFTFFRHIVARIFVVSHTEVCLCCCWCGFWFLFSGSFFLFCVAGWSHLSCIILHFIPRPKPHSSFLTGRSGWWHSYNHFLQPPCPWHETRSNWLQHARMYVCMCAFIYIDACIHTYVHIYDCG